VISAEVSAFLHDAKRFILNCCSTIDVSPLQIYSSAIVFAPTTSIVRNIFKDQIPQWIPLLPKVDSEWNACLQTLEGHSDSVTSVAFSRDSKHLASASYDKTVKIWDANTGACLQTLEGHSRWVRSVAFSRDGKHLASASHDHTVKIWDANTGACLQTLAGHSNSVTSVAFSRNGKHLASASDDKTVKIWDANTGACLQTLKGHSDLVRSVAFSRDGKHLASASDDWTVKIWDANTGACLKTINVGRTLINISFDITGSYLYTEIGTINLDMWTVSNLTLATTAYQMPYYQGYGLSADRIWITWNSQNLLWLPSAYRPSHSTVVESTVAIGCPSGRILIIQFSLDNPPVT
jgi:WD40 repeat protein